MTTRTHYIKTDPVPFHLALDLIKLWELRRNDRDYRVGDLLIQQETKYTGAEMAEGKPLQYTDRVLHREVTHVLSGYGLPDGVVILSVKPVVVFHDKVQEIIARLEEDSANACPACGGSGHKDDVPDTIAVVPTKPTDALLASMATRMRHDFGLLSADDQQHLLTVPRQLHEEVVGKGFYKAPEATQ